MRTFPFELSYLMSPGRNDSPGGTVPIGFSFAFAEAILISPERSAHPGVALGILVSARRSRSASQSIRARASTTTTKTLRNVYTTVANTTASHYRAGAFSSLIGRTEQTSAKPTWPPTMPISQRQKELWHSLNQFIIER